MLCEWYNDSELYHYVGFWLDDTPQKSIKKLKQLKENWKRSDTNKKKFVEELKKDIYGQLSNILEKESNRNPNENFDKKVFRPILLFHNIQTIINQNELHANEQIEYSFNLINRFPFYLYKLENWDIEHINSLTDNKMEKLKTQQDWLRNVQWFINDKTVKNKIEDFLKLDDSKNQDKQDLMKRFEKLRSECSLKTDNHWEENEKNSLKNYVLLDASTNRMYKNEIFPVKQKIVMAVDSGIPNQFTETVKRKFVPLCTKLVFMKFFSKKPNTAEDINYWTKDDAEWYLADIKRCLAQIKPKKGNEL